MAAGKYNMLIQQGATYQQEITIKNATTGVAINISGYTAACMVREQYTDTTPVATFTCVIPTGTDGKVIISLTAAQTSGIVIEKGVYDLELTKPDGITKDRLIQGNVVISKEATK